MAMRETPRSSALSVTVSLIARTLDAECLQLLARWLQLLRRPPVALGSHDFVESISDPLRDTKLSEHHGRDPIPVLDQGTQHILSSYERLSGV
jgi:hypothetical protein